ncbi:PucR family transcriptional regulator ligand-binding domain-containing protein [Streptomyces diastatochromogenes]|nr:PucR family transcriptional regulator ligand-binding domain-containing protein [Streptomyces diastatochromogenes]
MTETEQPSVPLRVLLADPALGLSQVAGPTEDRSVSTVGTTEIEDPTPYLVGGELLLTAGVRLPSEADGIDTYVRRVVAAGVAALGFGVAPCTTRSRPHSSPPVIAMGCPFCGSRRPHRSWRSGRPRTPRSPKPATARCGDLQGAVRPASAAARPDALQAVLTQLSAHTGAWAALYDAQGNELFSAGSRPRPPRRGWCATWPYAPPRAPAHVVRRADRLHLPQPPITTTAST